MKDGEKQEPGWQQIVTWAHEDLLRAQDNLDHTLRTAREDGVSFSDMSRWTGTSIATIRMRFRRKGW